MRVCAISVDLDEIRLYHAIHGSTAPGADAVAAVYRRALPRYRDFACDQGLPLTLFVVGADVEQPENAALLRSLAAAGHEIANHSYDHFYDLSRRPASEVRAQIARTNQVLCAATGQMPTGFRAPGYVVSDTLYDALAACGMAYSSSVFPCPYYYGAKLLAIGAHALSGRRSDSIIDRPGVVASALAARVVRAGAAPGQGLLELPIQVTPRWRLPFIGTSLTLLGPGGARRMARALVGLDWINLELHGIDLLDADDELAALARHQFDLRISLERKWATLAAVVDELRGAGYAFVRLDEVARGLGRGASA